MQWPLNIIGSLALAVAFAPALDAAMVVYSFDAPRFSANQTTPLLDRLPNSGSSTFEIDFVTTPTTAGFGILQIPQDIALFSGQIFIDRELPADVLTMTFNQFVDRIEFDFAIAEAGRLALDTPAGKASQNSAPLGGQGAPDGGTVVFSSTTPFNSARLEAFSNANVRTLFAIENLTLNVIPEPVTSLFVIFGVCGMAAGSRRRRVQNVERGARP
jgi:hypothetical protein